MPRAQTTAVDAYVAAKIRIDAALDQLRAASEDHFGVTVEAVHWGHVGDLNAIAATLEQLTARDCVREYL